MTDNVHSRRTLSGFGSFAELLDALYYDGHAVLDGLAAEFVNFHRWGSDYVPASQAFHDLLLERIHQIEHAEDLHNAISVIFADLIDREGRDESGMVDPSRLANRFGSTVGSAAGTLLRGVETVRGYTRIRDAVTANELIRFVSLFAPERIADLLDDPCLQPPLPVIDALRDCIGGLDESALTLVGVQHLMGSTATLFNCLAEDQIPASRVLLLGKPYSTNHAVLWHLQSQLGYVVHPGSYEYRGVREYHDEADAHIASLLATAIANTDHDEGRIILIDDGGRAIRMLHEGPFGSSVERFACVEQTRRGVRELEGVSLCCPVVNVAESRTKLVHESPIIAASVRDELMVRLDRLTAAGIPIEKEAAVIGYGAIGGAVAQALRDDGFDVSVFDPDAKKREAAASERFHVEATLAAVLGRARLIVGCTGFNSVRLEDYRLLQDNSVLISASSSDIEFAGWHLRSLARSCQDGHRVVDVFNLVHERFEDRLLYLGDLDHPCHFLYIAKVFGRRVFLLNGGFPVNFNGAIDPIAPEQIQLTRGLLYAAAVQASETQEAGLHDVSDQAQGIIENECVPG